MNKFLKTANKRIAELIKDLNADAQVALDKANEEEKGRITLSLLYYKIILQGCIAFEANVSDYVNAIKDCAMDETDIALILDKYCGEPAVSISLGDIELDENPEINIDVKEVKNPGDIELDENPFIDIDVKDVKTGSGIELDENPLINLEVQDIFNDLDIVLDENPYIDIDVKDVKNPGDIEMDENPKIKLDIKEIRNLGDIEMDENPKINIDVKDVKNLGDIEMDENPEINIDVKEVKNPGDIEIDENPKLKIDIKEVANVDIEQEKDSSNLFGALDFKVKENSAPYVFNAEDFEKQVKAEREAKRNKKNQEEDN